MRGLILKDFYNIVHNFKQMLILILFLSVCMIPSMGGEGFIIMSAIMCTMMTATTFAIDEKTNWSKYALVMPITKSEYVKSKFMVAGAFSLIGILVGAVIAIIVGIIQGNLKWTEIGACLVIGIALCMVYISLSVPLLIKFGCERARIIMIGGIFVPTFLFFAAYRLIQQLGVEMTKNRMIVGGIGVFIVLILGSILSMFISIKIMEKQEF